MSAEESSSEAEIYEVEKIVRKKVVRGNTLYLIKWKGYPSSENTWEPEENVQHCSELMKQFNERQAAKEAKKQAKSAEQSRSSSQTLRHRSSPRNASKPELIEDSELEDEAPPSKPEPAPVPVPEEKPAPVPEPKPAALVQEEEEEDEDEEEKVPEKIFSVYKKGTIVAYNVTNTDGTTGIITSDLMRKKFPTLLIDYLESLVPGSTA